MQRQTWCKSRVFATHANDPDDAKLDSPSMVRMNATYMGCLRGRLVGAVSVNNSILPRCNERWKYWGVPYSCNWATAPQQPWNLEATAPVAGDSELRRKTGGYNAPQLI